MMLAVSSSFVVRSSLEEMLESLQRRDEDGKGGDKPPALPARPKANSRSRPPSVKHRIPSSFKVSEPETAQQPINFDVEKGKGGRVRLTENGFLGKNFEELEPREFVTENSSPDCENMDVSKPETSSPRSRRRNSDSGRDGGLGSFSNKRLCIWCRSPEGSWEKGKIKSTIGEKALVLLSDDKVVTVRLHDLRPANPDILDTIEDLGQLSYLNEPSVFHTLECRYSQDLIYTKAGCILVAVNPLKDIPIYGNSFITAYREKVLCSPHVYGVVNEAYGEMMAGGGKQSIIISGESGSGKTETARRALEYLSAISGGSGGIESKVLQTSYILEAFGNAKTTRNDNSSRFGKLIEIYFNDEGKICSAHLITFLFEKSRVVHLVQGEQSYHVFYQLCSGASTDLLGHLGIKSASQYNYLSQGNCMEIPSVDDSQKFHMLLGALNAVGICKDDQDRIFELLAAVLWLGNISFLVTDEHTHVEVVQSEALNHSASLLGCSLDGLITVLSTRKVKAGKDVIARRLTLEQACERRDALARLIYTSLFDWLVEKINLSLAADEHGTRGSISILDICGFEASKKNGFEQFCINYANEKLQRHFHRHLFELEQEDYELEGIHWTRLECKDNNGCLDFFEKKPTGLMALLDEVSSLPKATNLTLANKLSLSSNGIKDGSFNVCHSFGEVVYDTSEFVSKNRDPLYTEVIHLLSSSSSELLQSFSFKLQPEIQSLQTQSFVSKLQVQLLKLFQHLDSTKPHFIHCIIPNNKQIPGSFEKDLVLQQLRCCSVLDAVKISKCGYPTKISFEEFTRRYTVLLPKSIAQQDPLSTSVAILQHSCILPDMYQVGYTKLFFRAGQIEMLEDARQKAVLGTLQARKCHVRHCGCRDVCDLTEATTTFQSYVRGEVARKEFKKMRHCRSSEGHQTHDAAVHIQSVIRSWMVRKRLDLKISETSQAVVEQGRIVQPSVAEELQRRASMAEAALEQKQENAELREQIKQLEAKIKSLQMARRSLDAGNSTAQPRRLHGSQSPPGSYDSDGTSTASMTPRCGTPARFAVDDTACRENNGGSNRVITTLAKEFEQRKQMFDLEAQAAVEVKSGSAAALNPVEEVQMLKCRFDSWKRNFRIRLREAEARARASRMRRPEGEKHRWKWWGLRRGGR